MPLNMEPQREMRGAAYKILIPELFGPLLKFAIEILLGSLSGDRALPTPKAKAEAYISGSRVELVLVHILYIAHCGSNFIHLRKSNNHNQETGCQQDTIAIIAF